MDDSPVLMLDLKAQYAALRREAAEAVERVVEAQDFIDGPDVAAFEAELAQYCKVPHAVGASSGSDALLMALMALGVGFDDEVVTTPYTSFATAGAIARLGARPVFVDIDPVTFTIDADAVAAAITQHTRAIVPVHLFGQTAEMGPILEAARGRGVPVVEDAAQAIGAEYRGRRVGSLGTMACLSFSPANDLGAFGAAGAVVTADRQLADRLRLLRSHGAGPKHCHAHVGGNFHLDTLHAAVLRVKLKRLDAWTAARQQHAAYFTSALTWAGLEGDALTTPRVVQSRHVFNQYVVRFAERDAVRQHLRQQRIETEVCYPQPLHLQRCFAHLGYRPGDFPVSEQAAATTLALPIHPELTVAQLERVVQSIKAACAAASQPGQRQAA